MELLRTAKAALDEGLIDQGDYDSVKTSFLRAQQIKAGLDSGFIPEAEYSHVKHAFLESLNIGLPSSGGRSARSDAAGEFLVLPASPDGRATSPLARGPSPVTRMGPLQAPQRPLQCPRRLQRLPGPSRVSRRPLPQRTLRQVQSEPHCRPRAVLLIHAMRRQMRSGQEPQAAQSPWRCLLQQQARMGRP